MSLTPMDIHNKEFNTKMRGYDETEVDSFLDRIVDAYGDALDKNIDITNENRQLKRQISDLKQQLAEYDRIKDSLNKSLISAQANAEKIKQDAHEEARKILDEAKTNAADKTKDLQAQYDTLNNDYELLKGKVANFRDETQKLLKDQLKELDDENWQYYLDQYYGRTRLYPADGGQPVLPDETPTDETNQNESNGSTESNVANQEVNADAINISVQSPVDNPTSNEVNSEQGLDEHQPQILSGDSPSHEENVTQPAPKRDQGPTIVFPDDYKNH
ncbi:DivIVA domain-containing protein [Lactobacillus sp. PV034]|uniref:DivIVA domain-containing protein n=1 Tax=Lactobacillus sp. PV034 TaxID=2594495 RepID=UPI0022409B4B|nr:DivIVA domain-containing protein [Lactobacillus sp. PV034]QNQ80602.1 DivIVA domain-containing protein [Lactobacillus sp. PV034]